MSIWTVRDAYLAIDAFAPFATAVPSDNVGLLVGKMDRPTHTILTALDATPAVVAEAKAIGAQLLVAHHPILKVPLTRLDEADPDAALVSEMIRASLSFIAAHTNLDIAPGGVNDTLLSRLGWQPLEADGFLRLGSFSPVKLSDLKAQVEAALGEPVLRFGNPDRVVSRFAVCSGSGGSEVARAASLGADVFLTGEIKHDVALSGLARGLCLLAAGHRATEICATDVLAKRLQLAADAVQSNVRIFVSKVDPFS